MIGVILILNSRGDIIISRAFRDNFNIRQLADTFRLEIIATKKVERCPVNVVNKVCFMHLRFDNLYIVCCSSQNADVTMVFQYIIRLLQIFKSYLPSGQVTEDNLREQFVTVQQIIDESMDYGYPQITETDLLKSFITEGQTSVDSVVKDKKDAQEITIKATGKIPWRREGIVYRENEVFLDVVEDVNMLMSQTGQILQREVIGRVIVKSFLSGMPECSITINDKMLLDMASQQNAITAAEGASVEGKSKVQLDDITFHPCVKLGKFDVDRSINFIPPDGEFVLMRYRTSESVAPPFRIVSSRVKEVAKTRLEVDFHLKSEFSSKVTATDVLIKVPCPSNTASVNVRVNNGKAKFDPAQKAIVWKIKRMVGVMELPFSCEISLIQTTLQNTDRMTAKPPISISFQLGMCAVSGLQVAALRVEEPKLRYTAQRWVRYMSSAGQYQCRL